MLLGHTDYVTAVAFSSDGRQIASASRTVIKVWDIDTGENKATLVDHELAKVSYASIEDVAFLPKRQL